MRYRLDPMHVRETDGDVLSGATVTVYKAGGLILAVCYADRTTTTPLSGSQTTTDSSGFFLFYVDSKDYANTQKFKIIISKTGYASITYDEIDLMPDLSGVRDPWVDVRAFGAVGDGVTDDSTALTNAFAAAVTAGRRAYLPAGTYKITSAIRTNAEIFGDSPAKSVIYNAGTGDALDLGGTGYYSLYQNFQIKGNASSRDGITLYTTGGDNPAYMQFDNVWSTYNGRHGLYHRNAWGTKYRGCKFHYNEGLGIYLITESGDPGTHNGVGFNQCESRWNGGSLTTTTYADLKGGVSVNGGACVTFDECIVESNNAWQFMTGHNTYQSLQNLNILNCYIEGRPSGTATIGGAFYFKYGGNIRVEGCEIGFGADAGTTSYAFYVDGAAAISEKNNQITGGGAGTKLYINAGAKLSRRAEAVVTIMMGDTGASGVPVTQTLLTASNDGSYKISGNIYCGRNSEAGGVFPFIATRNATARTVTVGSSIVGTATTSPTMAWNGNALEVTWGANHIGHIEFSYSQTSMPTTFTLGAYLARNDNLANLPF